MRFKCNNTLCGNEGFILMCETEEKSIWNTTYLINGNDKFVWAWHMHIRNKDKPWIELSMANKWFGWKLTLWYGKWKITFCWFLAWRNFIHHWHLCKYMMFFPQLLAWLLLGFRKRVRLFKGLISNYHILIRWRYWQWYF